MKQLHYTFSVEHAEKYGLNEAIMLHNFIYWININRANNNNYINGRYWTYNSSKAFQKLFPFWTQKQIEYTLAKLLDANILIKDCFNQDKRDRTAWYTLSDNFFSECISEKKEMPTTNLGNIISEKKEMYNIADKKQQIKNTNLNNITTASGFSSNENLVSVNNAHTQTTYQGNLDNSTGKKNLQVEAVKITKAELQKQDEIENFVNEHNSFNENEVALITEYITDRKAVYKSKVKNTKQALNALLNDIAEVKKQIPLDWVFQKDGEVYSNCGTAGDKTKPFQTIKIDYFKNVLQQGKQKLATNRMVLPSKIDITLNHEEDLEF